MLNRRIERLEKKQIRQAIVCIVMPGESEEDALRRAGLEHSGFNDIFFIKIVVVS